MMDFSAIKNRQWYLLGAIGGVILTGGLLYILLSSGSGVISRPAPSYKSDVTTGVSRINPQEAWVHRMGNEAEVLKKRLDTLENLLTKLIKMNDGKISEGANHASLPQADSASASPAASIESVRNDLKAEQIRSTLPSPPGASGQVLPSPPGTPSDSQTAFQTVDPQPGVIQPGALQAPPFRSKTVRKVTLSLTNARSNKPLKTHDNTIPAGTFAGAILLGGVDASASIQASSDPRPALLRITDTGTLPRKFKSDLKGCHALAACYGDISSERVMMRLEKLTCTERKTGEIIEVKIQGYVAGEDGRTGVRGTVVDRAGESMRNAMIGGFVSGMGDFLSQPRNALTFSPATGLAQTHPMGVEDALRHGAGKGVGNALEKYADFYIKRAEQVQPVIQVAAGRQVDIVFTEGVSINETLYRQTTSRSKDQERYQQLQTGEGGGPYSNGERRES